MKRLIVLFPSVCIISALVACGSEGAAFSYQGDFLNYLGLQDMGVITVAGGVTRAKLQEAETLGRTLK